MLIGGCYEVRQEPVGAYQLAFSAKNTSTMQGALVMSLIY